MLTVVCLELKNFYSRGKGLGGKKEKKEGEVIFYRVNGTEVEFLGLTQKSSI